MNKFFLVLLLFTLLFSRSFAQKPPLPYGSLPNQSQLTWHETEMYCIIHYGVDTYTDKEWGFGDESPSLINPVNFDAMQIVAAAKAGGFKGVVVVAKHHDGFCIWPTKTTDHNISKSPYKNGKGDMIKEYQLACEKLNMKLGLYCSPWDRNNAEYGKPKYLDIYREQLKELYTNYGPVFISWHDGANGGNGYYGGNVGDRKIDRSSYYEWEKTWAMIKQWQPNAAIFGDIGPDIRWVGNEEGEAGETAWATYEPKAPEDGKKPSNGFSKYWEATEGTRTGKWMPAECDVPLRPGWFYHASQDDQVKTPYQILDLYYKSVGRGANLDLGLSPNPMGILSPQDVRSLKEFGDILRKTFASNLAKNAVFTPSNVRGGNKKKFGTAFLVDKDRYTYWATDNHVMTPNLVVKLPKITTFNVIQLRENIKLGQRINACAVDVWNHGKWEEIASATSIGANRLIRLAQNVNSNAVRLRITSSNASVAISDFGLYLEPEHLSLPKITRDKNGMVKIETESPVSAIYYTINGSEPNAASLSYKKPFALPQGGTVKAICANSKKNSSTSTKIFGLSKKGWTVVSHIPDTKRNSSFAIDDDPRTFWNNTTSDTTKNIQYPQEIAIDMGREVNVSTFTYLPRQDKKTAGIADRYQIYKSVDGKNWEPLMKGEFSNIKSNPIEQRMTLKKPQSIRYFKFSVSHVIEGKGLTIAEIGVANN